MSDNWSQLKIAAQLLKSLGIDPTHCTQADIILHHRDPIRVLAIFEVMPLQLDLEEGLGEVKTMMKEFTLVEKEGEL